MVFCKATKARTFICELRGNRDYARTYMVPNKQQMLDKQFLTYLHIRLGPKMANGSWKEGRPEVEAQEVGLDSLKTL